MGGTVTKLCKYNNLIEKIFGRRMIIQPFNSFSETEKDEIELLLSENANLFIRDSDDNIWLNHDIEKAFETLRGTNENIDLGRVGEHLSQIEFEMKIYFKLKKDSRITAIIKNFNNIILLLEENTKLVTKKRESDYGGSSEHIEKVGYLQHLLNQTGRLSNEIEIVSSFIETHRSTFGSLVNETLRKKIVEVKYTILNVRSTLSSEMHNIGELLRIVGMAIEKNKTLEKLKTIDFLLEKGRFYAETNYEELSDHIPSTIKVEIKTHLDSRYAWGEEYPERILELSQKKDESIKLKKKQRQEAKSKPKEKRVEHNDYIDPSDIYEAYLLQDKTLLSFIENIDFKNMREDSIVDVYLEVLGEYHNDMNVTSSTELEDTVDKRFSLLKIKNKKRSEERV